MELEFEELLDELFEDEFELEFEELLDELFELELELELLATRSRSPSCFASILVGAASTPSASPRCARASIAPSVTRAAPASVEMVCEYFMVRLHCWLTAAAPRGGPNDNG
ncbi:MAG: hypothetical protein ACRCTI_11615 [Beijerinckiaceae bacterium]